MNGTMLAMRLHAAGRSLSLDSVPQPEPQEHEVLLDVLALWGMPHGLASSRW